MVVVRTWYSTRTSVQTRTRVQRLIKMDQCQCTSPFGWTDRQKSTKPVPSDGRFQASPVRTSSNPKSRKKIARHAHLTRHSFGGRVGVVVRTDDLTRMFVHTRHWKRHGWLNAWVSDSRRPRHLGPQRPRGRRPKNARKTGKTPTSPSPPVDRCPLIWRETAKNRTCACPSLLRRGVTTNSGDDPLSTSAPVVAQRQAHPPQPGQELDLWSLHRFLYRLDQTVLHDNGLVNTLVAHNLVS